MKLNKVSVKLSNECIRIKNEFKLDCCTVPMLISSLFAIRDGDNFTNLFNAYFEKKLGIKLETIDKALTKLIHDSKDSHQSATENIVFESATGSITMPVDNELSLVIQYLQIFLSEEGKTEITPDYFSISMFATDSISLRNFLKKISVNYMEAESFFDKEKILSYEIVPYEISQFVTYSNPKYVGKNCNIVGREKELKEIYQNMLKPTKRNVILYGSPGVGKSAIGELLIHNISNDLCPNLFKGFKVFEMSVKDFMLTCNDSKEANELMNNLMNFLTRKKDNIILMIDEIQTILGKGGLFDQKKLDLSTTLKPILVRGDVRIIGMTTFIDFLYFNNDLALSRRFTGIEVKEPKIKDVLTMILPTVKQIEKEKDIMVSLEIVEKSIWYAACFNFNKKNPDKSLDVINGAIANAQLRNSNKVSIDDVIDVFKVSFERWNGMSSEMKRNIAYHEAGHYVIDRITNPGNSVTLAVSIYPTEEYMGINVYEVDTTITPNTNKEYFLNEIATLLAGRIAEKLVSGDINSGASNDLDSATAIAKDLITEFGMSNGIGKNRVYLAEGFGNEEGMQEVDEEVNKIITIAYKRCEKMLNLNRTFLDAIAAALLDKHILMKKELDEIWENAKKAEKAKKASEKKHIPSPLLQNHFSKTKKIAKKAMRTCKKKLKKFHK